ncbi:anti-sigma factor antagonist [uncultured Methanoregula sp.]|uniref:anti-sigma factor antagonist n=1 Tax=uncultured Methanoregula sp. TaxID=1005933 RepID=UPI002AAACE73|nr:anti-sigma factor antagonist [uncultured Methanoregula sp.]
MSSVLQIRQKKAPLADVLYLSGRLDSNTSAELDTVLRNLVGSGSLQIVLNLTDIEYVSSSGLRVMLIWLRKMKKKQGELKIACLKPRVKEILFFAGFNRLFNLYDTEAAALETFAYADLDDREKRILDAVSLTLDIEEDRRQTEENLIQSETMYRVIFESSGTAMAIVDEDLTILIVNSEFAKLVGYQKEELSEVLTLIPFVVRDDLGMVTEFHDLVRNNTDKDARHYEFRLKDRFGNIKNVYVILDMIPGTHRRIYSLLDITELRKIEEDLRHELARKREFIILTAHELRTPLQPVMGYLHMILEDPAASGLTIDTTALLEKCSKNVDHVREIIEHIIKLSDMGYDPEQMLPRFKPQYRETSPKNVLSTYISVLKCSSDIGISIDIPEDLKIITDGEYFFLITQSLIFNIIRYSAVPAKIEITVHIDEKNYHFIIRNRRAVIAQEIIPILFKPFSVTKESKLLEKFGYLGISLPVAKKMAELLNGDITVTSESDAGSAFTLSLPRYKDTH